MMGKKLIHESRERKVMAKPLSEYVAKDHLLVKIDKEIDFTFIYDEVKAFYAEYGTDSADPVVIFKMLLIGYLYNITSERLLVPSINENLAYRYFIGYALDEEVPYRSNFTRMRQRWGEDTFRRIFNKVVTLCVEANLVGNKSASIDSTCVDAKGSQETEKLQREKMIQEYLDVVKETDREINIETLHEIKKESSCKRDYHAKKNYMTAI